MTNEQREKWLEERRTGIGSSDVATIVGLNPHPESSPLDVQLSKLGHETFAGNNATRWGTKCEDDVAELYEEDNGLKLTPGVLVRHPSNPIFLATPDRYKPSGEIVEIKVTDSRNADRWGFAGTDQVPQEYLVQTQWQHYVVSAARGTPLGPVEIAVVIGMGDFRVYRIEPHAELQGVLADRAAAWWQKHIIDRDPIEVSGADMNRVAALLHRNMRGEFLEADWWQEYVMLYWADLKRQIKELEAVEAGITGHLKMMLGELPGMKGRFGSANYGAPGKSVSWKAVAETAGATAEQIEKHTSAKARVLVPHFKKNLLTQTL